MKRIKPLIITLTLAMIVSTGILAVASPKTAMAADAATAKQPCAGEDFLGFPVWYRGVINKSTCNIEVPAEDKGGVSKFVWQIVLNIIDILLRVVGYISVFFILYGGFQFITSQGSPDGAAKARQTILNAVIGLVVSLVSVAIVNLVIIDGLLK